MAIVTGYTAARMKQIEDSAVVDGEIVGNDLLLEPHGFATQPLVYPKINAGNVRGPQGIQGIPGEVTEAELAAGLAATRIPAGVIEMWGGDVAPTGYLMCNGQAVDRTTYAALFAAIGTKWGVGNGTTTFNVPPFDNRFPVGKGIAPHANLNDRGGSKDATVPAHAHTAPSHSHSTPAHQHSIASHGHDATHSHSAVANPGTTTHQHTGRTNVDGAHNHYLDEYGHNQYMTQDPTGGAAALQLIPGTSALGWDFDVGSYAETHWHDFTTNPAGGDHGHAIGVSTYNGGTGGSGTQVTASGEGAGGSGPAGNAATTTDGSPVTNLNLPPYITVNFIIKT